MIRTLLILSTLICVSYSTHAQEGGSVRKSRPNYTEQIDIRKDAQIKINKCILRELAKRNIATIDIINESYEIGTTCVFEYKVFIRELVREYKLWSPKEREEINTKKRILRNLVPAYRGPGWMDKIVMEKIIEYSAFVKENPGFLQKSENEIEAEIIKRIDKDTARIIDRILIQYKKTPTLDENEKDDEMKE